ncbi:MAG: DUF488 domain-containing protein [Firmicutes bacterium]|nr:DUF488 domain-containing protein [Bacillota bacterium]
MILQTIGFTKKSARQFFDSLKSAKSNLLIDIRLNNNSQLSGFTKSEDLAYFLDEICGCAYIHEINLAPTKELLDGYRNKRISWDEYAKRYKELIAQRGICDNFIGRFAAYERVVLLCSEPLPDKCHRRLAAEMLCDANPGVVTEHL